jgi:D-glycero-D-manno-heptose 1,7-bisphosphate phosphatase
MALLDLRGVRGGIERFRQPAVFVDKDGTLVEDIPYNVDCSRIHLVPDASFALPLFHRYGFKIILISNQAGVARGYFKESQLEPVREKITELLEKIHVPLAGFYYCPHDAAAPPGPFSTACECRKPAPGMFFKAAEDHDVDLESSWMIGDILDDIQAGRRAGCKTILINQGSETEWEITPERVPDFIAPNLAEAAWVIAMKTGIRKTRRILA